MIRLFSNNLHLNISDYKDKELYDLIIIRTGGENTMRILDEILLRPKNANQIAKSLKLDYKTVTYHLEIICTHNYASKEQFNKHYSYFPSEKLIRNLDEYMKIKKLLLKELGRKNE